METIITPTTSNSMFINGIYFNGTNFVDRLNYPLSNVWVVFCVWTNHNSKFGCEIADIKTENFCKQYKIENKKY